MISTQNTSSKSQHRIAPLGHIHGHIQASVQSRGITQGSYAVAAVLLSLSCLVTFLGVTEDPSLSWVFCDATDLPALSTMIV